METLYSSVRGLVRFLAATSAALLFPCCLVAQSSGGSISGLVTDPDGAAVVGASVSATDLDRNVTFRGESNSTGLYVLGPLPPGRYRLVVEMNGFRRWILEEFPLSTQQKASINVQLQVGPVSESIQVTGEAQMIEPSSSTLSTVVENKKIMDLPLNGRNVFQLALLAPGVAGWQPASPTGGIAEGFESAGRFLVSGGRESANAILLDGVAVNSNGQQPGYEFTTGLPSVEGIQEFRVQTNAYSAEYGRAGGGMLTLTTKSGTNELHGTAFEFLRNSRMDANNWFANAAGAPLGSFKRNEFGGSLGGPVYLPKLYRGKNRTFFFTNYEGRRLRSASLARLTVPSALEQVGDFSDTRNAQGALRVIYDPLTTRPNPDRPGSHIRTPFPGNRLPQDRLEPIALNVIKLYPQPNAPGDRFTRQFNYVVRAAAKGTVDRGTARVDHVLNDKHRFFVRYNVFNHDSAQPKIWPDNAACPGCYSALTRQNNGAIEFTSVLNPSTVMTLRYGFGRGLLDRGSWYQGFRPSTLGFPQYIEQGADLLVFPQFTVDDVTSPGLEHHWNYKTSTMVHNVVASVTRVMGSHAIKAGTEMRFNLLNYMQAPWSLQFNFSRAMTQGPDPRTPTTTAGTGLASFLLGTATGGSVIHRMRPATANQYYGVYVQDDFKASRNLTVNLGLRWDIENGLTERYDRFAVFDPYVRNPLSDTLNMDLRGGYLFPGKGLGRRLHEMVWGQFNPRIGLAYQAGIRTVIRVGYGIFFSSATFGAHGALGQGQMFSSTTQFLASLDGITPYRSLRDPFPDGIVFPEGPARGLLAATGQPVNNVPIPANMMTPYNQQWNFTIQRSLAKDLALELAYAGNKGTHLPLPWNFDQLRPELMSPDQRLLDLVPNPFYGAIRVGALSQANVQRGQLLTPYPHYPNVNLPANGWGNSNYHSLQARLERRFSGGTSVMVAYTFSKTMSDSGDDMWLDTAVRNHYCRACEKSLSGYDQRHRLVASFTYELPIGRGKRIGSDWSVWADAFLGGWQVNGIATVNSALPLTFGVVQNTSYSFGGGQFPDSTGRSADLGSKRSLAMWFDVEQFLLPRPYTFGNLSRTHPTLRSDRVENLDLSIFKSFRLLEKARIQFRAESFNAFNHPVFGAPNTTVGAVNFGRVNGQANAPRQMQLALKLIF